MDLYEEGRLDGINHGGGELTNGELHIAITHLTKQIRNDLLADGWDADAAARCEYNAGFIAGLADRINL